MKNIHICLILLFFISTPFVSPLLYDGTGKTFVNFYNSTETSFINKTFYDNSATMVGKEVKIIITLKRGQNESAIIEYLSQINATEVVLHWLIHAVSAKVNTRYVEDIRQRPEVEKVWRDEKVHKYPREEIGGW